MATTIDLGCFGLPSVFNAASEACAMCPCMTACGKASTNVLNALKAHAKKKREAKEKAAAPTPPVSVSFYPSPALNAELPKVEKTVKPTARGPLKRLMEGSFKELAPEKFKRGENAFAANRRSDLRVAGALLAKGGTFTKAELREALVAVLGWSESSAKSQVRETLAFLTALKLVTINKKRIDLI